MILMYFKKQVSIPTAITLVGKLSPRGRKGPIQNCMWICFSFWLPLSSSLPLGLFFTPSPSSRFFRWALAGGTPSIWLLVRFRRNPPSCLAPPQARPSRGGDLLLLASLYTARIAIG